MDAGADPHGSDEGGRWFANQIDKLAASGIEDAHELAARLRIWWAAMCERGCEHFRANISRDELLNLHCPDLGKHLLEFARRLPPTVGDPKADAKSVLGGPGEGRPPLLCAGPAAQLEPATTLCRVVSAPAVVHDRYGYLTDAALSVYKNRPRELVEHIRQMDPDAVNRLLNQDAVFRGQLQVLFWADEAELTANGRGSMETIARYLGLAGDGDPEPHPGLVFRLVDPAVPRHVPSGFDAFDNKYFLPSSCRPGEPPPQYGRTKNLLPGANTPGAREVVTPAVRRVHVEYFDVVD